MPLAVDDCGPLRSHTLHYTYAEDSRSVFSGLKIAAIIRCAERLIMLRHWLTIQGIGYAITRDICEMVSFADSNTS
jgi:hypothetical protein